MSDLQPPSNSGYDAFCEALRSWDDSKISGKAKYDEGKPRLIEVALLAALLEPETLRSEDPGPAIVRAAALLDRVSQYLFRDLSTAAQCALLRQYAGTNDAEARAWELVEPLWSTENREKMREAAIRKKRGEAPQADDDKVLEVAVPLQFKDVLQAPWSKHKTMRELIALLERVKFPPRYLQAQAITREAYELALGKDVTRGKALERKRKQRSRADQDQKPLRSKSGKSTKQKKKRITPGQKVAATGQKRPATGQKGLAP
jgi:hypothetical protein